MKIAHCTFIIVHFLLCVAAGAQSPLYQKSYHLREEYCLGIEVLPNDDRLLGGYTVESSGLRAGLLMRTDARGLLLWSKTYKVAGNECVIFDVKLKNNGNFLALYRINSSQNRGGWMELDQNGNVLWAYRTTQESMLKKILVMPDGFLLSGQLNTSGGQFDTGLLIKIQENGAVVWTAAYDVPAGLFFNECRADALGFLYCSGYVGSGAAADGMMMKLSPGGELLWAKTVGDDQYDELGSVAQAGEDLIWTGSSEGLGNGFPGLWILRTDANGTVKWSKTYANGNDVLRASSMLPLPGNQFLICSNADPATLDNKAVLVKIAQNGDILWANRFKTNGERDFLFNVRPSEKGFVAAGYAARNGDEDVFVAQFDPEGQLPLCCPESYGFERSEELPQSDNFVPDAGPAVGTTVVSFNVAAVSPTLTDICPYVDFNFNVSADSICPGDCVDISFPEPTPGIAYSWVFENGTPASSDTVPPPQVCFEGGTNGFIILQANNGLCDLETVRTLPVCKRAPNFPNAFTPNGDGNNDTFRPLLYFAVRNYRLRIFDRWGALVFETDQPDAAWDGRLDGAGDAPSDVYVWMLEYEKVIGGNGPELHRGELTLLR